MIFRPDLAEKVMDGRKTVTRRLVREDNPRSLWHPDNAPKLAGKRLAVQPGLGKRAIGTVQVVSVTRDPDFVPLDISDEEAVREGFADTYWRSPWLQFCDAWEDLYGREAMHATCDVWRIEFTDPAPAGERGEPMTITEERLNALNSIPLLRERLIDWLARKASAFLVWAYERERARAPICPDCEQPEPDCRCAQKQDEQAIAESAYAAGYERALDVLEQNQL